MNRIGIFMLLLSLSSSDAIAQRAPFCVVDRSGNSRCSYHDVNYCKQIAYATGGVCAPNVGLPSVPNSDRPRSFAEGFAQGFNESRKARLQHERELELIRAQNEPLKTEGGFLYRCKDEEGFYVYREDPVPGCEVSSIRKP
jgi:hypothetical protein